VVVLAVHIQREVQRVLQILVAAVAVDLTITVLRVLAVQVS
jgi:hypothetical protein